MVRYRLPFIRALLEMCDDISKSFFHSGPKDRLFRIYLAKIADVSSSLSNLPLRMFDRFNRHRFKTLKLSELVADMVLHDRLKFWTRLPK